MDEYFKVRIEQYQPDNLLSVSWKPFIDQTLAYDKSGFKFLPMTPVSDAGDDGDEVDSMVSAGSGARHLMALLN